MLRGGWFVSGDWVSYAHGCFTVRLDCVLWDVSGFKEMVISSAVGCWCYQKLWLCIWLSLLIMRVQLLIIYEFYMG